MTRHLIHLGDLGENLASLLTLAQTLKERRNASSNYQPLRGKSVALVFEKASTRTRLSLEVAVAELGGHPVFVSNASSQVGRGEPIADTARVLSRMVHALAFRTSSESRLLEMAKYSTVPVLNALTDSTHPMQLLADLLTVRQTLGDLRGLKYAWVGDGNNMANSWVEAAGMLGLHLSLACPEGYSPAQEWLDFAKRRGANVEVVRDPQKAVAGAHVVSTDVFASMGQEGEQAARLKHFQGMRLTRKLLELADKKVMVLHCLPAHRGEEIDEEVLEGPHSYVWDQAENRLHTAKAALLWALGLDE